MFRIEVIFWEDISTGYTKERLRTYKDDPITVDSERAIGRHMSTIQTRDIPLNTNRIEIICHKI